MKYVVEWASFKDYPNIFNEFNIVTEWCKENCQGEFEGGTYNLLLMTGEFKFELEEDAMAFKLRWI